MSRSNSVLGSLVVAGFLIACGKGGEADGTSSASALSAGWQCAPWQREALAKELANATPNMDCTLIVPDNPLTADGLATPWILEATDPSKGPCIEANPSQGAFVEATIYDPAAHSVFIYHPLVVDLGKSALAPTVKPNLPAGAVVGIWVGSNSTFNRLEGASDTTLANANCIDGLNGDDFGEVSACNAAQFFAATDPDLASGALVAPPLGTASDGLPCPTTRDFFIVDQDQSDNVITTYLSDACGNTAQSNATNVSELHDTTVIANGSDNRLLTKVDAALGCVPWTTTDLTGGPVDSSQALNELHATHFQQAPIALVPLGDPMVLLGGENDDETGIPSVAKMDLYRSLVGQEPDVLSDTKRYCQELLDVAAPRLAKDRAVLTPEPSLVPAVGNNLFTFLAARLMATFAPPNGDGAGLGPTGCTQILGVANPVTVTTNNQGVAISATIK